MGQKQDLNPGLLTLKPGLSMAPAPEGGSAHVSGTFHVYASHSICVTTNCTSKGETQYFGWYWGAGAWTRAKTPGEEKGTPLPPTHDGHRAGAGRDMSFSSSLPGLQGRRQGTHTEKELPPSWLWQPSLGHQAQPSPGTDRLRLSHQQAG